MFAVLQSHWYMSDAAAQLPQVLLDVQLLGVTLCMSETLAQHPKASDTGQVSPFLQEIAGLSRQEVNQDLNVAASLLHSLLNNIQQQLATAAGFINAEGYMHSPAPPKPVGLTCLSSEDIEAVCVRALATLQWLNDQDRTRQPPPGRYIGNVQIAIIVMLHKLLLIHVLGVHQHLQTLFVHGLVPLMECWQNYGTKMPELNALCLVVLWQMTSSMPRPADSEVDQKLQVSGMFAMWQCFSESLCCVCWVITVAVVSKSCMFCMHGCIFNSICWCECLQGALDVHLPSHPLQLLLNNQHLFVCRIYIVNTSGHSYLRHPRLLLFAGQSSQRPSLLEYAVDIQQALSCAFEQNSCCQAFLAHPDHAEGFHNTIRNLQGTPHAQMIAAASFLQLCLVEQDLQSKQKAYSSYAVLSGIMENITECIIAALQVMPVNSASITIAQQFADPWPFVGIASHKCPSITNI